MNIRSFLYITSSSLSAIYINAVTCIWDCFYQFSSPPSPENFVHLASISAGWLLRAQAIENKNPFIFSCWCKAPVEYANLYATLDLRTKRVIYNHNKKITSLLTESL